MSVVSLLGVNVMNNPAKFTDKYEFEITFECLEQLEKGMRHSLLILVSMIRLYSLTTPTYRPRVEADLRRLRHLVSSFSLLSRAPRPAAGAA